MRCGLPILALAASIIVGGCAKEARTLASDPPLTAPGSSDDPRIRYFAGNRYQISQGGRYFAWYGCGACHLPSALGHLDPPQGGRFDATYRAITDRHGALRYGAIIPQQQLWQLTAFVDDLPREQPDMLRRQSLDQLGEPVGPSWNGPVR